MKKKQLANLIMVVIICAIFLGGVLGVGYIRGWFDTKDAATALLHKLQGTVNIERAGVSYPVVEDTVLRAGDKLTTLPGATAVIKLGDDTVTLGSSGALTVEDPSAGKLTLQVSGGEVFVNSEQAVQLSFELGAVTVEQATAALSVRSGAQTVSVFRGTVDQAKAGEAIEYVGGEATVQPMALKGLNDFTVSQIRAVGKTVTLCYTEQDLKQLEVDRQQALQDLLNGQTNQTQHVHSYTVQIVAPGCTAGGYTQYTCQCGEQYTDDETAAAGHLWGSWETADAPDKEKRQCQNCNASEERTVNNAHTHSYAIKIVAPGCTEGGYTQYVCQCGESYKDSELAAVGHSWGPWTTIREATSQENGLLERRCQHCGTAEEKVVQKLPESHTHSYTQQVIAPTCTAEGCTLHSCTCGAAYTDSATPATGHSWSDWTNIKEATQTQEGLQERTCSSCGSKEQRVTQKLPSVHSHSYAAEVIKPTCTVQGYTKYVCACGAAYTDSATPAAGHSWGDWATVREATSTQEGLQERTCGSCGEKQQQTVAVLHPDAKGYVYITIRCDTVLDNMQDLQAGKSEFVPADGVILPMVEVPYYENETVFEVLNRVCKTANIQIEYSWTPLYNSYYIEGINHLYEFDCGEQSGWMYKVNEWFPNYGCSSYTVGDGDVIVWCYTCKGLGADVGSEWMGEE